MTYEEVKRLLTRPVYAGIVAAPQWSVSPRKGQHAPIVSIETHQRIQQCLTENAKTPARKDFDADFLLRGVVICGCCSTPLTACWSSGGNARYPYYLRPKRGCEVYGKSVKRDVIEGEFAGKRLILAA